MTKQRNGGGKGGGGQQTQAHPSRGLTLTAAEKRTLSQLAEKEELAAEKEREAKLIEAVTRSLYKKKKKSKGGSSSSSTSEDDDDNNDDSDNSDDDTDLKKKKRARSKKKKKDKSKARASSSDGEGSSSKGTSNSKSKKKKASKLSRLHQELKGVKEEAEVAKKDIEEFRKELFEKFDKLQSELVEGKSVLHTPDKARPITKDDLRAVVAEAGQAATEKAEASRPRKGIMAWLDEQQQSTPSSATNPPSTTPSKQVTTITAVMRQWLDETAADKEKYTPLDDKNPTLNSTGVTLCANVARKASSWYSTPEDIELLKKIVDDYKLQTQAASSSGLIKAILVALLARKYDFDPEKLYVTKSNIMAMTK